MRRQRSKGQGTIFKRKNTGSYIVAYYDHNGRRRVQSTRTTDRRAAELILNKHIADAALRREGVIDPRADAFIAANRIALKDHFKAYCQHCRRSGHSPKHVLEKERHFAGFLKTGATRLSDLTVESVTNFMWTLKQRGLSARTANYARQVFIAFANWARQTGKIEQNLLTIVKRHDERNDRRLVRRPLTDDEMSALLAVAEPRGRSAWYLSAALAGLRRGDLMALRWGDVDFGQKTITVRQGKSGRIDVLPLHPQLADALRRRYEASPGLPQAKVFPSTVTERTVKNDFLRAGLARREETPDGKTRIVTTDEAGRVIDLHALRTTLGTNLARAGVAPQVAQRIMRHSDYKTTLNHYTVLGLVDTAQAVSQLPAIGKARHAAVS